MADSQPQTITAEDGKTVHGVVGEYMDVDSLLSACERVRDAGYTKADAFTPFPVHGIDKALGIKPTVLPWIALVCGLTGTSIALLMQIGMNGDWFSSWIKNFSYEYIISGKPYVSLPAFIPVTFELTILLASFGTFFGMWALNGLPKFSNPMFTSPRFDRATDDTFFLFLPANDEKFDESGAKVLLGELGAEHVEPVVDDDTSLTIPKPLLVGLAATIALSFIPALVVARMRVTKSTSPRFHIFPDMDFSPAKDAQQTTTLFADGRAMRPLVPGTVVRGYPGIEGLDVDYEFQTGVDMEALAAIDASRVERLVALVDEGETEAEEVDGVGDGDVASEAPSDSDEAAPVDEAEAAPPEDNTPWLTSNPLLLDEATLRRGQEQFHIYCAVCHGMNGRGNGLVNQRAQKILASTWTPPSNMHDPTLHQDKYADGKLFSTISNGIRRMPGYAAQIKARDRWAIVGYVRALQASQSASINDIPEEQRDSIAEEQEAVKKAIADAEAEAAKKAAESE
ncbi:MAG: quinol:electron acceptor oxidoreductase subunit ActD [Planctomycetota bacterium]